MTPVFIDLSETVDEFVLSTDEIKSLSRFVLDNVADEYVRKWEKLIDEGLHSTRAEYKRGIFQDASDDFSVVLGLTPRQSPMALMLEEGASPFDMKEGFEKSSKKKIGKNGGWYLTIPFKWATADALGEAGVFAGKMPKPIEKLVKVLKPNETLQIDAIKKQAGKFSGIGENKTSGYTHKFNIYEGIGRQQTGSGQSENRGGYVSFRRVSANSDPDAWMHPGLEAHNFMDKAMDDLDIGSVVDKAVDDFLSNR